MRNRIVTSLCLAALVTVSACGHNQSSSGATSAPAATPPSTSPSAQGPQSSEGIGSPATSSEQASPVAIASQPTSSAPAPVPSPSASASPSGNLLSYVRGAFVKSWSVAASNRGAPLLASGGGWTIHPDFKTAPQVLFELPTVARIDAINITTYGATDPDTHVDVDASVNGLAFSRAGTITFPATGYERTGTLAGPLQARWVRFTFLRKPGGTLIIESISAAGSMTLPSLSFNGRWALADNANGDGGMIFAPTVGAVNPDDHLKPDGAQIATFERDGAMSGGPCTRTDPLWNGPIRNGTATLGGSDVLTVVAKGSLLVGSVSGLPFVARRIGAAPTCDVAAAGSGPTVLVIKRIPTNGGPEADPKVAPGFHYQTLFLPGLSPAALNRAHAAILANDCAANTDLTSEQTKALLDYVANGHILIIRDADVCSHSDYAFIPYPFRTAATGAGGASGHELQIADSSVLGSNDPKDRAHFLDVRAYLAIETQQIGDADIMQTNDPHWCGLLFAKNAKGVSGWVHAYARFGRGVLIYNGFDVDDMGARIPQAIQIARAEYGLSPQTALPCMARVALERNGPRRIVAALRPAAPSIAKQLEQGGRARTYGIHFDVASARIKSQSEATILEIARVLQIHPLWRMRVEGHTDSDGGAAYNLQLSERRAQAVVDELVSKYRIASSRLEARGYGLTRPIASNAAETGKALNRRVELVRVP